MCKGDDEKRIDPRSDCLSTVCETASRSTGFLLKRDKDKRSYGRQGACHWLNAPF